MVKIKRDRSVVLPNYFAVSCLSIARKARRASSSKVPERHSCFEVSTGKNVEKVLNINQ